MTTWSYQKRVSEDGGFDIFFFEAGTDEQEFCVVWTETEEEAENAQLVILSVGEDDEGEYLDVVDDDELLLELGKLFEERLSDEYDIEE
jgi:hypothetical protein